MSKNIKLKKTLPNPFRKSMNIQLQMKSSRGTFKNGSKLKQIKINKIGNIKNVGKFFLINY